MYSENIRNLLILNFIILGMLYYIIKAFFGYKYIFLKFTNNCKKGKENIYEN